MLTAAGFAAADFIEGKTAMKFAFLSLSIFTLFAHASPSEDMSRIIDALYRADGEAVYGSLTLENQQAISMMISMFRLAPGEVANQIRQELDVQVSASEILNLREQDLIRIIIDSPMFRNEMPWPRQSLTCEECVMQGDTAFVYVSICGEDSAYGYPMVLQEGSWRLAGEFFKEN